VGAGGCSTGAPSRTIRHTTPHPLPLLRNNTLLTAVSTSAETWFVNCEFERNRAGQYGGAVLLEGGCPAAYFLNYWFKVGNGA